MVKIPKELHGAMVKSGKMADYVACCERLERDGVRSSDIPHMAAMDVVPELADKFEKAIAKSNAEKYVKAKATAKRRRDANINGYRLIEWVVESLEEPKVKREDAPNAAAWSVLKAARDDDDVKRDVLKKYLDSRLKLDAAKGDTDTRKMDGQSEYDILEGLSSEVLA